MYTVNSGQIACHGGGGARAIPQLLLGRGRLLDLILVLQER